MSKHSATMNNGLLQREWRARARGGRSESRLKDAKGGTQTEENGRWDGKKKKNIVHIERGERPNRR